MRSKVFNKSEFDIAPKPDIVEMKPQDQENSRLDWSFQTRASDLISSCLSFKKRRWWLPHSISFQPVYLSKKGRGFPIHYALVREI